MRLDILSEAIALATRAHAGQLDKAGAPYIGHPQRVARSVAAAGGSKTAQVVAYLHDVVEDTAWTFDELRSAGFSDEVVTAIDALTRRRDETYVEFVARAGSNPIARLVKLADLADNLDPARIKNVALVLDPLGEMSPFDDPERYDAASSKADAEAAEFWAVVERNRRYRSAWMALAGSEFPLGAPFPLAHAASTRTTLEVPDNLRQAPPPSKTGDGQDHASEAGALEVVLSTMERGRNERTQITARIRADGDLEVAYYTAGDEVLRDTGDSDYEHYTTVSWMKLPSLVHFLRNELGRPLPREIAPPRPQEILGLMKARFGGPETPSSDFEQWLRERKIPYDAFTY